MKNDSIFYTLFQQFPETLFQLIEKPKEEANNYLFKTFELKEASFRMDGLFIPIDEQSNDPLYFVEVQFRYDAKIYSRLFSEIFIYLNQNNPAQDWKAVLIFGSRKFAPKNSHPYRNLINSDQVTIIYLDELPENRFDSLNLMILELIVISEEKAEIKGKELLQQIKGEITNITIKENMLNLIETILLTKFSNLTKEEIKKMFALEDLKQTRLGKELIDEGRQEGRQEGLKEGLKEGIKEGLKEGLKEGIKEGLKEGIELEQSKTIHALLSRNFSIEEIADLLEISIKKVQQEANKT